MNEAGAKGNPSPLKRPFALRRNKLPYLLASAKRDDMCRKGEEMHWACFVSIRRVKQWVEHTREQGLKRIEPKSNAVRARKKGKMPRQQKKFWKRLNKKKGEAEKLWRMSLAFLQILVYQPLKVARVHLRANFAVKLIPPPSEKPAPLRPLSPVPFLPVLTRIRNTAPRPLDCCLLGSYNQALLLQTMAVA